jgi:hypothetical protein
MMSYPEWCRREARRIRILRFAEGCVEAALLVVLLAFVVWVAR